MSTVNVGFLASRGYEGSSCLYPALHHRSFIMTRFGRVGSNCGIFSLSFSLASRLVKRQGRAECGEDRPQCRLWKFSGSSSFARRQFPDPGFFECSWRACLPGNKKGQKQNSVNDSTMGDYSSANPLAKSTPQAEMAIDSCRRVLASGHATLASPSRRSATWSLSSQNVISLYCTSRLWQSQSVVPSMHKQLRISTRYWAGICIILIPVRQTTFFWNTAEHT